MSVNGSPLSVAQRPNYPSNRMHPGGQSKSAVGFLLLDASLRPIAFNAEALRVLSYPNDLANDDRANTRQTDVLMAQRIRDRLRSRQPSPEAPLVTEFRSGRRRYLCRAFIVDLDAEGPARARIAALLERPVFGFVPLSPVSEQFNLTRRERDALECLLQGLSNKEIASRMSVSPNTVKAFLRLIMLKMEVSSRAAVVAKLMTSSP